jgi:Domain of unknown function (DUF6048)
LKLLTNILLLLVALPALAQESPYSVPLDSTNKSRQYIPSGIRLGVDLLGPVLGAIDNRKTSYELTLETDISHFNFIMEMGYQEFAEKNDNIDYAMNGSYLRLGPEINFLKSNKQLSSFTFGLRYAWSSFNEKLVGTVTEVNWGDVPVNFDIQNNKSQWVEMTTGVKVRLWKGLFSGYTLRFRFIRTGSVPDVPFEPYFVPGYGLADQINTWGFNYYVLYRFQWSKKPIFTK